MLGLLLKDIYNVRKQAIWYLAMIALFCGLSIILKNVAFSSTIGILVTISMPLTAIAYEEKDGWQKFVVASGTKIRTIVGEKYLLGIVFALVSIIVYAVTFMLVGETENRAVEITAPICMQFFVLTVVLPMVFKFGVERGRVYMIVAAVALMAVLIAVFPLLEDMQEGGTIFIICACVFTVVAICVSFLASLKIYTSKEF